VEVRKNTFVERRRPGRPKIFCQLKMKEWMTGFEKSAWLYEQLWICLVRWVDGGQLGTNLMKEVGMKILEGRLIDFCTFLIFIDTY